MEHSEKILQLLHSNDPKNVELAISLAQSLSKQGVNTDFVIHELFQCQLPLCFERGWALDHIKEFYSDEYNIEFHYTIKGQTYELCLELTDDDYATDVVVLMSTALDQMVNLQRLTFLTLYAKHRMTMTLDFNHLHALKTLTLKCLDIPELPPEIKQFRNLEELSITDCYITSIPPEIRTLGKLKKLNLSYNGKWEFQDNPHLDKIYVPLEGIPKTLGNLTALEELVLDNNGLTEVPSELGQLINLKILSLSNNKLRAIPEEIKGLEHLKELNIARNPISETEKERIKQWLPNCQITWDLI